MSHLCGLVLTVTPALRIGPDSGDAATSANTWEKSFAYVPASNGTKFTILHFMNVSLPGTSRLEVELGYDKDTFTSADGGSFWTRPVNVGVVGGSITIGTSRAARTTAVPRWIAMVEARACTVLSRVSTASRTAIPS